MTSPEPVSDTSAAGSSGQRGVRWIVATAVVAICFIWVVPSFAPYEDIASALAAARRSLSPMTTAVLAVVILGNLVTPSLNQMAALPGLRLHNAVTVDWATTTVTNVVPGGSAGAVGLAWSTYRGLGFTTDEVGRSVVVTGVFDQLVKLGVPLPAVLWMLSEQRQLSEGGSVSRALVLQSAVIAAILFTLAAGLAAIVLADGQAGKRLADTSGRLANRVINPILSRRGTAVIDWPARLENLRTDTRRLLSDRGALLIATVLVGHANLFVLLMLSLRVAGVADSSVGWAAGLTAFSFARLVTAVPLTPGALGVAEVSLIGAVDLVSDAPVAAVVLAVALFRAASYVLPTGLGLPAMLVVATTSSQLGQP